MTMQDMGNVLVEKRPMMLSVARSIDFDDAEDIVQDASLKALENVSKLNSNNIVGWLVTIVKRTAIDYLRREETRTMYEEDEDICFLSSMMDVNRALEYLNEQQRQAVSLYIKGYNKREIAEMLNVPQGTIQTRIFYGCEKLRKIL